MAKWLAQTAKDCGYSLPPPPKALVASTLPRWQTKKQAPKTSTVQPQKQVVPTDTYPLLARYIVQHQPPVDIPISLVNTVKRTIKARQRVSRHYNADGMTSGSDGHLPFIRILESVRDILKLGSSAHHPRPAIETMPRKTDDATNAYSGLEVEQPSEETSPAPKAASKPITPASGIVEFEAEPMKKEEAEEFAALCFMTDIDNLMDYVKDIWQRYADGQVGLIAASVAAYLPVTIVDRLQEDFAAQSGWDGDDLQLIQRCYTMRCASIGLETTVSCDGLASHEAATGGPSYTSPDFAQSTLLAISDVLLNLGRHDLKRVPVYEPGVNGVVDKSRPRCGKTTEEKIADDRIVMKDVLPLFQSACVAGLDFEVHMPDLLLRLLHLYLSGEQGFSILLAFAAQAYLEAYHIVGTRADAAFREVQALGRSIRMSATATIDLNRQPAKGRSNSMRQAEDQAEDLLSVLNENVFKDRAQTLLEKKKVAQPHPPEFALLKQHPLLCGTMAFMLHISAQAVGLTYCNRWTSAIPCAHLFNAMQQEKLVHSAWPDLELMIEHQTAEFVFYGGHPRTPEEYSTRYALALGTSPTMFAANRRDNSFKHNVNGVRLVEERTPVSCMIRDMRTGENDADEPDLEVLLNKLYEPAADGVTDGANVLTGVRRKQPLRGTEKKRIKSQTTRFLSPKQVLQAVEAAVSVEFDALKFDYMALHRQCWTLLERMKAELPSKVASLKTSSGQYELLDLVTEVLGEYAAHVKALEQCPKALRKKLGEASEQITLFAGVVEGYLQELKQQRTGEEQNEQLGDATGGRDGVLVGRQVTIQDCVDDDDNPVNIGEPVCW